jgi:hypothetical protein
MIEPTNWWKTKLVIFIANHTPKCHDITRLISQSMEAPLPFRTRMAIKFHYLICVWCERYRDQLGFLSKALHSCPEQSDTPAGGRLTTGARTRLKSRLRAGGAGIEPR